MFSKIFSEKHRSGIFLLLFSAALVVVNIIRIICVPITIDESPSEQDLALSYSDYFHLNKVTANIHILHSMLRKFFIEAFSNTPFFLRLDILLAQVLFLLITYRLLSKIFDNKFWVVTTFLAINLNPFLFEFWGLSRGYGLAIALMMTSIFFLFSFLESRKKKALLLTLFFAIAAVYANFSLLYFFLSVISLLTIESLLLTRHEKEYRKTLEVLFPILLASIGLYLLIHEPIQKLIDNKELYYGGNFNVLCDTIQTLVQTTLFENTKDNLLVLIWYYPIATLVMGLFLYWLIQLFRKGFSSDRRNGIVFTWLFTTPLIINTIQHELFGSKLLIDRTALFLYPLFILCFAVSLFSFSQRKKQVYSKVLMILFCALLGFSFMKNTNFNRSWQWWENNYNLVVLQRIATKEKNRKAKLKLRVNWVFFPSLNYYINRHYKDLFEPMVFTQQDPEKDTVFDYYYLKRNELQYLNERYKIDTCFADSNLVLLHK